MRLRLKSIKRSTQQRELVDDAVSAYREWRRECGAVRNAYRRWTGASSLETGLARQLASSPGVSA